MHKQRPLWINVSKVTFETLLRPQLHTYGDELRAVEVTLQMRLLIR